MRGHLQAAFLTFVLVGGCGGSHSTPEALPDGQSVVTCEESAEGCRAGARKHCGDLFVNEIDLKESTQAKKESWTLTKQIYHGELRFRCDSARARRISKADNIARFRIACVRAIGNCYELAEHACPKGYEVLGSTGAKKPTQQSAGELVVECR